MLSKNHCLAFLVAIAFAASAGADIDVSSDGTDGDLFVGADQTLTIDLGGAVAGNWDDPSSQPGNGIFDAAKWAVVFKYSSVIIQDGATVNFTNHPSGAPVVWLVQGDVNISGTVNLNGAGGHHYTLNPTHAEPGPGGFRGGRGSDDASAGSAGFGPGGASTGDGSSHGSGGSYASAGGQGGYGGGAVGPAYGNPLILPLIGGSGAAGGQGGSGGAGGGAGGGAILIASNTTITMTITGAITASGGNYGAGGCHGGAGSGGAIRLIADSISGAGALNAAPGSCGSGCGSNGRIRVEANSIALDNSNPIYTAGLPGATARIWPDEFSPVIRVVSLAGQPVAIDPSRNLNFPNQEVLISAIGDVPLVIQAYNVPPVATLTVRVIRKSGSDTEFTAVLVDEPAGLWQASLQIPDQISAIQVRAVLP